MYYFSSWLIIYIFILLCVFKTVSTYVPDEVKPHRTTHTFTLQRYIYRNINIYDNTPPSSSPLSPPPLIASNPWLCVCVCVVKAPTTFDPSLEHVDLTNYQLTHFAEVRIHTSFPCPPLLSSISRFGFLFKIIHVICFICLWFVLFGLR